MGDKGATREGVLGEKQLRFVEQYLVDLNATQAAIRAGYSKKTASSQGHRLLRNAEVQKAIEAGRKAQSAASGVTVQRVIQEMATIAFVDPRSLFDEAGNPIPIPQLPENVARAISGFEVDETFLGSGKDGELPMRVRTKKLKLWDKGRQLDALLKHLGADADKPEQPEMRVTAYAKVEGLDAVAKRLAEIVGKK